ncbi:hypothetical protein RRG08_038122 [Elysia crispata]|uniref:Uncharacterized protein n=1 Tax=Elysia crispata TaxID=231223 RepID=A0AAE0ZZK5_9GAST|nr:hypothetical protein RRG08_038122 [Elysia crispata]
MVVGDSSKQSAFSPSLSPSPARCSGLLIVHLAVDWTVCDSWSTGTFCGANIFVVTTSLPQRNGNGKAGAQNELKICRSFVPGISLVPRPKYLFSAIRYKINDGEKKINEEGPQIPLPLGHSATDFFLIQKRFSKETEQGGHLQELYEDYQWRTHHLEYQLYFDPSIAKYGIPTWHSPTISSSRAAAEPERWPTFQLSYAHTRQCQCPRL